MNKEINHETLTTESVSEGHPDKVADQIAEAILDFFLDKDEETHISCDVFVTQSLITVGGEIKSKLTIDEKLKREIKTLIYHLIKNEIGYTEETWSGLNKLEIKLLFKPQSTEIDQLVTKEKYKVGAGDNCTVFGYANKDHNYFPMFQGLSNNILQKINNIRKYDSFLKDRLRFGPDGKVQIVFQDETLIKIVLCQQFIDKLTNEEKEERSEIIKEKIIAPILKTKKIKIKNQNWELKLINFQKGGPESDSGLTGRKIIIDAYGTFVPHGGGCLPGKDVSKTDKTLSLFARYVAKHIVALNLASEITLQISATIGEGDLVNITFLKNDETKDNQQQIERIINLFFNWNLKEIIQRLKLKRQKYSPFASYGYFGRDFPQATWEKLDLLVQIQNKIKKVW